MPQSSLSSKDVPGYYWRDYTGRIPDDAVPGGWTTNKEVTYIGQVFSKGYGGMFPATIYPHQVDVHFAIRGSKKSEGFVQILCSRNTKLFRWIPVDNRQLHIQSIGYNLVRGGQENGKWLHIGRLQYQGEVIIGKVCSGTVGNAKLWFAHNGSEHSAEHYEVLIYEGQN